MPQGEKPAMALPDALIVRYFRAGELDQITAVEAMPDGRFKVHVDARVDLWRDLGGGVGFVPDAD